MVGTGLEPKIIGSAASAATNVADKTGFLAFIGNTADYIWNNKKYFDEALRKVNTLVITASQLLDNCPTDEGFDQISFDWFLRVKGLISDLKSSGITKEIPALWTDVGDNIDLFSFDTDSHRWYKTEQYKKLDHRTDWRESVHRTRLIKAHHIGKKSKESSDEVVRLTIDYEGKLKEDKTLYKKKPGSALREQAEMNTLVSIASKLLDHCPKDRGFDEIHFEWFRQVTQLIGDFKSSGIATEIPAAWSRVQENINQFSNNSMYKPENYEGVNPEHIYQTLVRNFAATEEEINTRSERYSSRAKDLIKEYNDRLREEHKAKTLFRRRPRCQLPDENHGVRFKSFKCRSEIINKVSRSLNDSEPQTTLIYGPGGIGKTTILVEIAKNAEKDKKFCRVVYAKISTNPDVNAIQDTIAAQLGMSWQPEDNTERSTQLKEKIEELGKVLVILDDVWGNENIMGKIGIPPIPGVKVLVGTRRRDLSLGVASKIQIDVLSKEDSWSLLCQVAPVADDPDSNITPYAKQIRDECCGLPLALVVIGKALAQSTEDEWERAVDDLKNSNPTNLEGVEAALYKIIRYSYEHLPIRNKIIRKVFLYCCLFPELEEVHLVDLQRHLDKDEEVKSLAEEDRNFSTEVDLGIKLAASVDTLEHYGLLKKHCRLGGIIVKMHDVVRDVAVFIAREKEYAFIGDAARQKMKFNSKTLKKYKRMSISNINEEHDSTAWPRLHILLIRGNTVLPDIFCKKLAISLSVLDLSGTGMSTLPTSMKNLKNVQTLLLNGCRKLSDVAVIVKLQGLQVLSLRESVVKLLPKNMNNLQNLIVLDWENSTPQGDTDPKVTQENIKEIRWVKELSLNTKSITDGAFLEITKLKRLKAVKLYVTKSILSSAEFFAGEKQCTWHKFTIYNNLNSPLLSEKKNFNLSIEDLQEVTHGVQVLLRQAEEVVIKNCFQNATISDLSMNGGTKTGLVLTEATGEGTLKNTSTLRLTDCANISYLTSEDSLSKEISEDDVALTELEEMEFARLKILIGIIKPSSKDHQDTATCKFFGKLRKITVTSCQEIKCVIPKDVLQNVHNTLEVLSVRDCEKVECIFQLEASCSGSFTRLKSIVLDNLEKLNCICQGISSHETLKYLKELFVSKCNMLTSLFTIHVAAQLENLQKLTVQDNTGLTEIISTEGPKAALSVQAFSRVTHLSLQGLPKLKHFNIGDINIDWPALIKLKLRACPALTELPIGLRMNTIDLDSSDDWTWYNQLINQGRPKCFEIWVNGEKHGSQATPHVTRNNKC